MKQTKNLETMSVRQASRMLGLCYGTGLKFARNGQLPCVRLGRQFRVLKGPFERMLKETPSKGATA
jgi:excisionase family DNA binding protein